VDEIRPEMLNALRTVPVEWQTGVVVPIFKKGDQRVCSNYRGITLISLSGKVYSRVLERRLPPIVEPVVLLATSDRDLQHALGGLQPSVKRSG